MCKKQRDERDSALDAEHRALMRAAAIESDRDKIQRQFKVGRVYWLSAVLRGTALTYKTRCGGQLGGVHMFVSAKNWQDWVISVKYITTKNRKFFLLDAVYILTLCTVL